MKILAIVFLSLCLFESTALGQHDNSFPIRVRGENLSDKAKIKQLERKAEYERERSISFARRGIGYKPTQTSLEVALPAAASDGIAHLNQLNRIYPKLSELARPWYRYEFSVVKKYTQRLIER